MSNWTELDRAWVWREPKNGALHITVRDGRAGKDVVVDVPRRLAAYADLNALLDGTPGKGEEATS